MEQQRVFLSAAVEDTADTIVSIPSKYLEKSCSTCLKVQVQVYPWALMHEYPPTTRFGLLGRTIQNIIPSITYKVMRPTPTCP